MTVESKIDYSEQSVTRNWGERSRRQEKPCVWTGSSPSTREARDDDIVFPSISPPAMWPRVFPSL